MLGLSGQSVVSQDMFGICRPSIKTIIVNLNCLNVISSVGKTFIHILRITNENANNFLQIVTFVW